MKIKDKHCICKKWEKEYRKAFSNRWRLGKAEVILAQERGELCPFCGKKLVYKYRKGFLLVQFPPPLIDKPDPDRNNPEAFVSLKELKRMLEESK